jgi:hypothetical protein
VEAFPNAFLGVLTPEDELLSAPKLKRGWRFDWLHQRTVTTGNLESRLSEMLQLPGYVWRRLKSETDHELRAFVLHFFDLSVRQHRKHSTRIKL